MRKTYTGMITKLEPNQIFVFGSNTQGIHGAGAARFACNNFGAIYGHFSGTMGQSYGIVTKDLTKDIHPSIKPQFIIDQIESLYYLAEVLNNKEYLIAYNTNPNLNGYTPAQMATMFKFAALNRCIDKLTSISDNIVFEEGFNDLVFNQ